MSLKRSILVGTAALVLVLLPLGGSVFAGATPADVQSSSQAAAQVDNTNTNTNLGFLFAIYIITWAGFFAYIFVVSRRQRSLEREIDRLQRLLDQQGEVAGKG